MEISALRVATVCQKGALQGHLHLETQIYHIEDRLGLLFQQYLVSTLYPSLPFSATVTKTSGHRHRRITL